MPIHTVKQGDCLTKIAAAHGFGRWRRIYEHPENEALRQKRPNPHVLYPGDKIFVPEQQPAVVSCATSALHTFVLRRPRRPLHLTVEDIYGKRIANAPYTLTVGKEKHEGTTDGQGRIVREILIDAEEGELEVQMYRWPLKIGHLNPSADAPDSGISGIQARLRNLGYDPGPIDGVEGPRTKEAIRAFQRRTAGLQVDGICGPQTLARLVEAYGC